MENRKYAEIILPHINSQGRTIEDIAERTGKTKTTISTYVNDCRNRGHDIEKTKNKDGVFVYRYRAKNTRKIEPAPILNLDDYSNPDHINASVNGKSKFIAECLQKKVGFKITSQQAILYGLHLADQTLNPDEFDETE